MMRNVYAFASIILILSCSPEAKDNTYQRPTGIIDKNESDYSDSLKQVYFEELYFAENGLNVDSIRQLNRQERVKFRQAQRQEFKKNQPTESFANGQIVGTWYERGPTNEAGDMREIEYNPVNDDFYAISVGRHLWKGNLDGQNWQLLNDSERFETVNLKVLPRDTSVRILASFGTGTDNKVIRFSDDEGQSWTKATGFTFYDGWGRGKRLISHSNDSVVYYMAHTWQGSPWGRVLQLYQSTDQGVTFTKIWNSPIGHEYTDADIWKSHESDSIYLVDLKGKISYSIIYNSDSANSIFSAPRDFSGSTITGNGLYLSGWLNPATSEFELYFITDNTDNVYKSTNYGQSWTFLSQASENVWVKGWLVNPNTGELYVGGFQLNKSSDGFNWQEQYPYWWVYYANSKDSMHVDIMNIEYFEKSDGTPFIIALNHAGVHVTYDNFSSTQNLGLNSLNVVTLYDQTTAKDGFLYCGAQDKGSFVFTGDSRIDFNPFSTLNKTTGDGMIGEFINNDQSFLTMIQNGQIGCLADRVNSNPSWYTIPGTNKPGWINPMVGTPDSMDNVVYVAGGNLNGGPGSYLIRMDMSFNGGGVQWNPYQFPYNFMANSDNGNSVIKAIYNSPANSNRHYVATQDASFFRSSNNALNWSKVNSSLPSSMIPWDIITSKTDADHVFICGTGFSNTGVYESMDGGVNFTPLNHQIPLATFYEVILSDNEEVLFAATSEGPYAYVFADNEWYSLTGAMTPIVDFNSVDNIGNNVIRFGTYGRGIWDFDADILINVAGTISENSSNKRSLYPNPISSNQMLKMKGASMENAEVIFCDLKGQQVKSVALNGSQFKHGLKPGTYLYEVRSPKLNTKGKLIVTK